MNKPDNAYDDMQEMLAHHEKTIEELSAQLAGQWKTISDMESKIYVLTKRLVAVEDSSLDAPHVDKPPHY